MNQRLIFIHLQRFLWMTIVMVVLGPMFAWGYVDKYNDGQKRVLMLGDSITIMSTGVGPQIREAFAGLANVHIISNGSAFENFQDTDFALSEVSPGESHISRWINNETWDVINFNTGLHDMVYRFPSKYDPPSSYASKLGQVIDEIKVHSGQATLIWRESTYVPNPELNEREKAVDGTPRNNVELFYNAAAAPVVAAKGITLVDSIATLSATAERRDVNDVHYTTAGYRKLAPPIIENIYNQLALPSGMRVDFGAPSTSGEIVQAGYYDFKPTTNARFVATDLGAQKHVEVTLANSNGSTTRDALGGAGTAESDLLRDFVFASGTPLGVIISGLEAGDYSFTGFFHDSDASHGTADVNVSVDGGQNFTDAMDVTYTTGMSPASIGTGSFTFTSDGMNDVVFQISATGGDGTSVLNGFEIVTADVPEPSTIVLLCLGSLSLAIYRFRRSLLSNY